MQKVQVIERPSEYELRFYTKYNPDFIAEVKSLKCERKWDKELRAWRVLVKNDKEGREVSQLIMKWFGQNVDLESKFRKLIEQSRSTGDGENERIVLAGGELYPYQIAGVKFLRSRRRCLLGDEMGLGKTVQALTAVHLENAYPCLVVCPKAVKAVWRSEIAKWLGEEQISNFEIVNYDVLEKHKAHLMSVQFKAVIVDESHYIKNPKTKRFQNLAEILRSQHPDLVFFLTGTAILNRPIELVTTLDLLGWLDKFGGFWKFAKRYCDAYKHAYGWDFSGSANLDELHERLRILGYLRREKSQVLTELPEKQRVKIQLELDEESRQMYERAERDFAELLRINHAKRAEIEARLGEGGKEASPDLTALYNERQAIMLTWIEKLKQLTMKMKFNEIVEFVENIIEQGEKVVIFAIHHELVDFLCRKFGCDSITGDTSEKKRAEIIEAFQTRPDKKVLVCNIKAGGVGITLNAAHFCVFAEMGWTPAEHEQAEDRLHRIGQKSAVTVYYCVCKNTIEDYIFDLVFFKKKRTTDAVNKGVVEDLDIQIFDEIEKILLSKHYGGVEDDKAHKTEA